MQLPEIEHIKFTQLPDELLDIERELDRATALKLAALYGGTHLSVPGWAHIKPDHRLSIEFGHETAIAISKAFGSLAGHGSSVMIPMCREEFFFRGVYRYFMLGLSADDIALELGCHRTNVFRALKELRGAGILPTDPLHFLSEEQVHWLSEIFSCGLPPTNNENKTHLARALRVPRSAIDAFAKRQKSKGTS